MAVFEYDPNKSDANRVKHGIDFEVAQALWNDENVIEYPSLYRGEARFLVIGFLTGQHWPAIITYRGENIRIISVRPSRQNEVTLYESRRIR